MICGQCWCETDAFWFSFGSLMLNRQYQFITTENIESFPNIAIFLKECIGDLCFNKMELMSDQGKEVLKPKLLRLVSQQGNPPSNWTSEYLQFDKFRTDKSGVWNSNHCSLLLKILHCCSSYFKRVRPQLTKAGQKAGNRK